MSIAAVTIAMKLEILRTQKSTTEGCSEWQGWLREQGLSVSLLGSARSPWLPRNYVWSNSRRRTRSSTSAADASAQFSVPRSFCRALPNSPDAHTRGSAPRAAPGSGGLRQRRAPAAAHPTRSRGRGSPSAPSRPFPRVGRLNGPENEAAGSQTPCPQPPPPPPLHYAPLRPAPAPRPTYLRGSRASAGWRWRTAPGSACCTARQREPAAWWATEWRKCRWWSLTGG